MDILLSILGLIIAWFVISNFLQSSKLNSTVDFLEKEITAIKPYVNKEKELIDFLIKSQRTIRISDNKLMEKEFGVQWTNPEMEDFLFSHKIDSSTLTAHGHSEKFITFMMFADYTSNGVNIQCLATPTTFHGVTKEAQILASRLNIRGKLLKSVI